MEKRPAIPANIKRRVLVETGHRCAIPQCRYIETEIHHITPWATCKAHDYENLIALCPNCHNRADRGEIDRKSLRIYKANLRTAHDKFSNLEIDTLFELEKLQQGMTVFWPQFNLIMIKRVIDASFVSVDGGFSGMSVGGFQLVIHRIMLTKKGRKFISDLSG